MRVLLYEYRKTIRHLKKAYREAELIEDSDQRDNEKKIINSMIRDLEYVIEWIEHGRQPGNRRGADKTTVYLKPVNVMDQYEGYSPLEYLSTDEKLYEENPDIKDALSLLTDREQEIFILHHVELLSAAEISDLLEVKRGTILKTMKRANKKIERMTIK